MHSREQSESRSEVASAKIYERFLNKHGLTAKVSRGKNPPDWVFQVDRGDAKSESWAVEVTELHRNFPVGSDFVPERSITRPVLKEQVRRARSQLGAVKRDVKIVPVKPGDSHPKSVLSGIDPRDLILVSIDSKEISEVGRPCGSNFEGQASTATRLAVNRKAPIFRKLSTFEYRVLLLYSEFLFPPDPIPVMDTLYHLAPILGDFDEVCLIHENQITVVLGPLELLGKPTVLT